MGINAARTEESREGREAGIEENLWRR